MKRSLTLSALAVSTFFAAAAAAHDPNAYDSLPRTPTSTAKPAPSTCEELADTERFQADWTDPGTRALQRRCAAEAEAAAAAKAEEEAG